MSNPVCQSDSSFKPDIWSQLFQQELRFHSPKDAVELTLKRLREIYSSPEGADEIERELPEIGTRILKRVNRFNSALQQRQEQLEAIQSRLQLLVQGLKQRRDPSAITQGRITKFYKSSDDIEKRLQRCKEQRSRRWEPDLVLSEFLSARATPHYSPIAKESVQHCVLTRLSDLIRFFSSGVGPLKVRNWNSSGLIMTFTGHADEIPVHELAAQLTTMLCESGCGCAMIVEKGHAEAAVAKCGAKHTLKAWRSSIFSSESFLAFWEYVDQALLGRVGNRFKGKAYTSSMAYPLLVNHVVKQNILRYDCNVCHATTVNPCKDKKCPVKFNQHSLALVGEEDFLIGIEYKLKLQDVVVWKCKTCSTKFGGNRFFRAVLCGAGCTESGHDLCPQPQCQEKHGNRTAKTWKMLFEQRETQTRFQSECSPESFRSASTVFHSHPWLGQALSYFSLNLPLGRRFLNAAGPVFPSQLSTGDLEQLERILNAGWEVGECRTPLVGFIQIEEDWTIGGLGALVRGTMNGTIQLQKRILFLELVGDRFCDWRRELCLLASRSWFQPISMWLLGLRDDALPDGGEVYAALFAKRATLAGLPANPAALTAVLNDTLGEKIRAISKLGERWDSIRNVLAEVTIPIHPGADDVRFLRNVLGNSIRHGVPFLLSLGVLSGFSLPAFVPTQEDWGWLDHQLNSVPEEFIDDRGQAFAPHPDLQPTSFQEKPRLVGSFDSSNKSDEQIRMELLLSSPSVKEFALAASERIRVLATPSLA